MVRKLGKYIGLQFDEIVYSMLADDFGGHPFLIRQACSVIHAECKGNRPAKVDKALYEKIKNKFLQNSAHYLDMIVQVLKDWYPDEYEMLKYLSQGDIKSFSAFAEDNSNFTKHLVGYGIVQQSVNGYAFNIEVVKEYLGNRYKYEKMNLSEDEKVQEISRRRSILEKSLRKTVKNALVIKHGKKFALDKMFSAIPENRRKSLQVNDIDTLLSPDNSPLFFLDLINLIKREWDDFQHIFELEKNKLILMLEEINQFGRPDAHAKSVENSVFAQLRLYFNKLEEIAERWR